MDLRFVRRSFGFRGVNVTIVWHPGWKIEHAQLDEGRVVRLWPEPAVLDFAALPEINPREFQFVDASIAEISMSRARFDELSRMPLNHETNALDLMIASFSD